MKKLVTFMKLPIQIAVGAYITVIAVIGTAFVVEHLSEDDGISFCGDLQIEVGFQPQIMDFSI